MNASEVPLSKALIAIPPVELLSDQQIRLVVLGSLHV